MSAISSSQENTGRRNGRGLQSDQPTGRWIIEAGGQAGKNGSQDARCASGNRKRASWGVRPARGPRRSKTVNGEHGALRKRKSLPPGRRSRQLGAAIQGDPSGHPPIRMHKKRLRRRFFPVVIALPIDQDRRFGMLLVTMAGNPMGIPVFPAQHRVARLKGRKRLIPMQIHPK